LIGIPRVCSGDLSSASDRVQMTERNRRAPPERPHFRDGWPSPAREYRGNGSPPMHRASPKNVGRTPRQLARISLGNVVWFYRWDIVLRYSTARMSSKPASIMALIQESIKGVAKNCSPEKNGIYALKNSSRYSSRHGIGRGR